MGRFLWALGAGVLLLAFLSPVPTEYVLAPLLGLAIWRVGVASLASFRRGADHIPSGEPVPVDFEVERVVYWCQGCGAEMLLLVRGTESAPRHCGERMTERREVARDAFPNG
jgi:hypothetical protein